MRTCVGILFVSLLIMSCKSDQQAIDEMEEGMNAEEIYFQDYEPPAEKWGYIDTSGAKAISDKYDAARPFRAGLAIVNYQGKWGMINKKDEKVIDFKYRSLFHFKDGLARFQNFKQQYGYLDMNGKEVIPATFDEADDFSDGFAKVDVNGFYSYIKADGSAAFESMYTKAGSFANGYAKVKPYEKYGLIDKAGNEVIPTEYDQVYSESSAMVRIKKGKLFGFYANDALAIPPAYTMATDFHNNIAAVMQDGAWSFIDKKGKTLKQLDYKLVEYGNEGFWMVNRDGQFGMIDGEGEVVIPVEYKLLYKYKEGKCAYSVDGYWGFFNDAGEKVTEPIYALVWDYNEGFARALAREGLVILDEDAQVEFVAPSLEMRDYEEGLAPIQYLN